MAETQTRGETPARSPGSGATTVAPPGNGVAQPGTVPGGPGGPPAGGHPGGAPAASEPTTTRPPASRRRWLIIATLLAVALIAGTIAGYRWWIDSLRYVSTSNAQIAGRLVQVGSVAAGRVAAVRYDIGERVRRDDVVATLHVPVSVTTSTGTTRTEYRQTNDTLVEVFSPVDGVVIARGANPSDTIPAGQPIMTVVDPRQLWVTANIEETQIRRVQLGQRVLVHVDALDLDLEGRVVAITPASAATFSLIPQNNTTGNFTHVIQLVPVRIALTEPDPRLMIGTSATVKIEVGE